MIRSIHLLIFFFFFFFYLIFIFSTYSAHLISHPWASPVLTQLLISSATLSATHSATHPPAYPPAYLPTLLSQGILHLLYCYICDVILLSNFVCFLRQMHCSNLPLDLISYPSVTVVSLQLPLVATLFV
ncbi:hypothetical protein HYPBUDRAFT_188760 [Hyphopichia burtonii NRRL Y-1933]|uniref:Uncharacterized protein n=1 Tax=Hyphopichia burtonii NRRL Y-1933 TaxID=984485 RepID=A0A1E4RMH7_9ASCO|nr:hypothetical protein HYPBUDRAFT_188760 [Hyphopichia burtonii NRRL Y-1933]ODV68474.1 hypothetical protein HYPBUDRAFT_188760 [Hyphopichia burtonii NRRL Y-1933]